MSERCAILVRGSLASCTVHSFQLRAAEELSVRKNGLGNIVYVDFTRVYPAVRVVVM